MYGVKYCHINNIMIFIIDVSVAFEQPSYNVSEEDGMVTLSFDIEGDTERDSIEINLTISDPSDPGM